MFIESSDDLINASLRLIDDKIDIHSIKISDNLVLKIKIDDIDWQDASKIDYKIASLVLSLQKDLIGFYNQTFGEKISLATIDKHPFLIVKLEVRDGCVELLAFLKTFIDKVFSDMNPKEKIIVLGLILGIVMTGGAAWVGVEYIKYLKETKIEEISAPNKERAIVALEKTNLALIENQHTPTYLSNHVKNGTVAIGDERPLSAKNLKELHKSKASGIEVSCNIDNIYVVTKYDFKDHAAFLEDGEHAFWSSTEFLDDDSRGKLKEIADKAISTKSVQSAQLQVTATIKDGSIKHAAIIGIGDKRSTTVKLSDLVISTRTPEERPSTARASLFESNQTQPKRDQSNMRFIRVTPTDSSSN